VRLELAAEDMRARLTTPEAGQDLGPGYPPDYPGLPDTAPTAAEFAAAVDPTPDPVALAEEYTASGLLPVPCRECHPELHRNQCVRDGCLAERLAEHAAANLPAAGTSSGPPAAELAANLPVSDPIDQTGAAVGAAGPGPAVPAPAVQLPTHAGRVMAWASRHDPRSLEFLVRDRLAHAVPVQDISRPHGPILDQGTVPPLNVHDGSSCTGHMAANLANMLTVAGVKGGPLARMMTHEDAVDLYDVAQRLDEWPGESYPGTSVLAAMKAGQRMGWWDSYLWAKGVRDIAQAILQVGGVGVGIPWREGMAEPGPSGILSCTGGQVGGHAIALFALSRTVAGRPGPWFGGLQSYGEAVGDHGVVWFHHADLAALLAGVGEAAVPLRVVP
jgi:hypothetical protein